MKSQKASGRKSRRPDARLKLSAPPDLNRKCRKCSSQWPAALMSCSRLEDGNTAMIWKTGSAWSPNCCVQCQLQCQNPRVV